MPAIRANRPVGACGGGSASGWRSISTACPSITSASSSWRWSSSACSSRSASASNRNRRTACGTGARPARESRSAHRNVSTRAPDMSDGGRGQSGGTAPTRRAPAPPRSPPRALPWPAHTRGLARSDTPSRRPRRTPTATDGTRRPASQSHPQRPPGYRVPRAPAPDTRSIRRASGPRFASVRCTIRSVNDAVLVSSNRLSETV